MDPQLLRLLCGILLRLCLDIVFQVSGVAEINNDAVLDVLFDRRNRRVESLVDDLVGKLEVLYELEVDILARKLLGPVVDVYLSVVLDGGLHQDHRPVESFTDIDNLSAKVVSDDSLENLASCDSYVDRRLYIRVISD